MKDHKKAEEVASNRMQLLSPLLAEGLDPAKAMVIREQICKNAGISDRTLRRYLEQYKSLGFAGLKPKGKGNCTREEAIPQDILNQAILLRREVPGRSVSQIIQILEWEGLVGKGQIKRSTLQEKLVEKGYSSRHMRMYSDSGVAARRFQRKYRNSLWHSDIKYGPYLSQNGEKKQVYLVTFLDDATRFVLHSEYYPTLDQSIVEDSFRKAILKYGAPESVYFDNGKQYRTKWMIRACSKLGIRLLYAKPYSPEATGKVERFNSLVDSFHDEVTLEKNFSLDRLNHLLDVWTEECYQNRPHSALSNMSPHCTYYTDQTTLKFVNPEELARAFLHCEERKVDKVGCVNFEGKKYEVGLTLIGCKVDVVYDPSDTSEITIECEGHKPFRVRELQIGERAGKRPKMPQAQQLQKAESSRLLDAAEKVNAQRNEIVKNAISFRKAGGQDV